ncbi:respiratory burst oxidase-like protein [Lasius niger]|uniref:Respiratory burst oxidase-like protein n=1 Tax=Lasius niger TaxID=67767 RepID=A0A0J7KQT2_LASNI|nr:respiratory burst oxidase-like protein [Lasius niger]
MEREKVTVTRSLKYPSVEMVHAVEFTEDPEMVALRHVKMRRLLERRRSFEQHDVEGQQFVSTLAEACGVSE